MKLKDLPPSERPRERLFREGVAALSLTELFAVLLRTGSGNRDVLEMSAELLHVLGGLKGISQASISEFYKIRGIGKAKVAVIAAAMELGRRLMIYETETEREGECEKWENKVISLCHLLSHEDREVIVSLFLDDKENIISRDRISYGGIEGAYLDVKYLFRRAVRLDAKGMVLVHNHPNGMLAPSREDILLTEFVERNLKVLDIKLIGHFIAAGGEKIRIPSRYTT